jgi:protoporphyrinogen oxidase
MGLALAERLATTGHQVVVYERAPQVGGLATWHDFGPFVWDRFYHVILPSDSSLIAFLGRIGLGDQLRWRPTRTGYFVDGKVYSVSTGLEFLRFPPLDLVSKLRLAATILYCSRIRDWRSLERESVESFLVRTSGRRTFDKFWRPLLLAKLGQHYKRVSAVFIWTYITRLFSARDASAQREHLGYVSGGYRTVFTRLLERIATAGGELRLGAEVAEIAAGSTGGIDITDGHGREHFDKVIFTAPVDTMRKVVAPALVDVPPPRDVEYLGVVCLALVTRKPLWPYYILNIGDERSPFTGVIGMSSLVDVTETNGRYLTYLPKYVMSDDPLLQQPEADLRAMFLDGVRQMAPEFDHGHIEVAAVNRARRVQPLQVIGYSDLVQPTRTRHPDFYVTNTSQFVNNTLNNNEVVRAVDTFFADYSGEFK